MILVTGGTGLVGSHLLFSLLKDGKNVRATHRKNSDLDAVKRVFGYYTENVESYFNQIDWVEANITDIPNLSEAFKGITEVYHAAAYVNFDPANFQKLQKSNVEGTANVVNLCLANSIEKLCYVSSVATLGETMDNSPITEETHWNPEAKNSVYAITKYGAEMEVWRGTQEGLKAVIVNPVVILGEGFWNTGSGLIVKAASKGYNFYTPGGIGVVDVKDVVSAMTLLMNSEINNQRFLLVGKNIAYQELFAALAIEMGQKPPKKAVPKWIMKTVRLFDWLSSKLFGTKRRVVKSHINSLYKTSRYDSSKIISALNFTFTPFEETAKRIAKIYSSES